MSNRSSFPVACRSLARRLDLSLPRLALVLPLSQTATAATLTRTSAFTYDPGSGLLLKEIIEPDDSSLCLVTEYQYDTYGNKTSATTRNCNGSTSEAATPTGDAVISPRTSTNTYDARGQFPTTSANALAQSETKTYDPRFGAVLSLTGPNGLTTTWAYDNFGRKTLETRADGTQTKWEYLYCTGIHNGSASCPTIGGASGAWLLVTTPLASDGVTQNGPIGNTYYDGLNREIRKETQGYDGSDGSGGTGSPTAIYQDTQYDSLGRPYKKSRPYYAGQTAYWTTLSYDSLNRPLQETQADGSITSTAYNGLTVTVTNAKSQTRSTVKNSQGQVVAVTDATSQTITFLYDPFGNLTRSTDALGNQTTLTYDLRGRKTGMQDPDMGQWSYAYNALGQLIRQTDAKAQVSTLSYDLLGRLTQRSEADLISAWYYDSYKNSVACPKGIGKLCQAETSTGYTRTHSYDSLGRPTSTSTTLDANYTTAVSYDPQGRLATQTYPTGLAVKYGYTALGYLKDLRDNTSNALYWQADSQDAEGHLLTQSFGNGVQTAQTYSASNGRLTAILAGAGNGVQNFSYQYDSLGNISSREDATQSLAETFVYDSLNRLTSSTVNSSGAGILTKSYAYDVLGNITSKSDLTLSAASNGYVYPASGASSMRPHGVALVNLNASAGGGYRTYTYDANGNLYQELQYDANGNPIAGKGRTEIYTSFNMPACIIGVPGAADCSVTGVSKSAFYYGPEHQRVKQISSSLGTTYYLNPGSNGDLLFEKDIKPDSSTEERHFLTAGGQVVALIKRINGSTWSTRYLHRDNLGSTTAVTDEAGTVIERLAYEPFGKRRFAIGTDDPNNSITPANTERGFTNHEHIDELGLIHMNGRVYDPTIGRVMSADFVNQDPMDLQAYNRYAYVRNNPLMYTDPSGQWFFGLSAFQFVAAVIVGSEVAHQAGIIDTSTTRTIQGIAVAAALGSPAGASALGFGGAGQAMVAGFAGGFVGSNFSVEGGIYGAASAGLFYGAGFVGEAGTFGRFAAHAGAGCVGAMIAGGNCGQGALSAGMGEIAGNLTKGLSFEARLIVKTIAGGTASELGGGKFANGAVTAAFGHLFNEGFKEHSDSGKSALGDLGAVDEYGCVKTSGPSVCVGPGAIRSVVANGISKTGLVIAETLAGKGNIVSQIQMSADELLNAGEKFLGRGYKEIGKSGSGVFRSADQTRQFRIDSNSLSGSHSPGTPHGHLEIYKPGAAKPVVNNHIPFVD